MKIRYLGHSSFQLIESTGTTIVTDPYSSSLGSEMPAVTAGARPALPEKNGGGFCYLPKRLYICTPLKGF